MAVGVACAGLPGWSWVSEQLVPYALGALLWTSFALMPLAGVRTGHHKKFTRTVVLVAALGTPVLVALLVPLFIPEGGPVALAAAIVLLAPCVDYVVVFTCIAGGEYRGLLAATPYLLSAQLLSVPMWTSVYVYMGILNMGGSWRNIPPPRRKLPQPCTAHRAPSSRLPGATLVNPLTAASANLRTRTQCKR